MRLDTPDRTRPHPSGRLDRAGPSDDDAERAVRLWPRPRPLVHRRGHPRLPRRFPRGPSHSRPKDSRADLHRQTVKRNSSQYSLPLKVLSYDELYQGWTMDRVVSKVGRKGNCTYCGVFRRQALDKGADVLGVDHIVTGHNADDVAETVLMNGTSSALSLTVAADESGQCCEGTLQGSKGAATSPPAPPRPTPLASPSNAASRSNTPTRKRSSCMPVRPPLLRLVPKGRSRCRRGRRRLQEARLLFDRMHVLADGIPRPRPGAGQGPRTDQAVFHPRRHLQRRGHGLCRQVGRQAALSTCVYQGRYQRLAVR